MKWFSNLKRLSMAGVPNGVMQRTALLSPSGTFFLHTIKFQNMRCNKSTSTPASMSTTTSTSASASTATAMLTFRCWCFRFFLEYSLFKNFKAVQRCRLGYCQRHGGHALGLHFFPVTARFHSKSTRLQATIIAFRSIVSAVVEICSFL